MNFSVDSGWETVILFQKSAMTTGREIRCISLISEGMVQFTGLLFLTETPLGGPVLLFFMEPRGMPPLKPGENQALFGRY
jgi:hypothetical protein